MDKNLASGRAAEMILATAALGLGLIVCYMALDLLVDGKITAMLSATTPKLHLLVTPPEDDDEQNAG